jgi:hypothetical protein
MMVTGLLVDLLMKMSTIIAESKLEKGFVN